MRFVLRCDTASLEMARSGAIWGSVWVEVDGDPFPETEWNDMPVAFIGELFDAVEYVRSLAGRSRRVRFFDGPFWVDVVSRPDNEIAISVNSRGASPEVVVAADGLIRSMMIVTRAFMEACRDRGWGDHGDVRRLRMLSHY